MMRGNYNSKLIIGTAQMGMDYGVSNKTGKITNAECFQILNYAQRHGINSLDTAEAYGDAHNIIGKYHQKNPQKKFKINTKFSSNSGIDVEKKVSSYLNQLNVDFIDVMMFHSLESFEHNYHKFNVLKDIKFGGLINKLGVSVYNNEEVDILLDDDDIDVIQMPFNLLDNNNLRLKTILKAKKKGKIIHTRSAFLQGMFFLNDYSKNFNCYGLKKYLTQINLISQTSQIPVLNLALGYCLQNNKIDGVIMGVDSLRQLKSNLNVITEPLNKKIISKIDQINVDEKELLNPTNW